MQLNILNVNLYCYETNFYFTELDFELLLKNMQTLRSPRPIYQLFMIQI